ncbi:hypothetical protein MLD38_011300 [Melastoma candidum]|uniref:Uncharacterized protein n=1 Tax=Melastoma candidum TaxID=119954 RepID=A0ACB9R216_9MYRT|nr:hypothetical protein MLD38_011300 [Melastoma candidum]
MMSMTTTTAGLDIKDYYYSSYKRKSPRRQNFINTIFTSTLGLAAKSLVSFANSSNLADPHLPSHHPWPRVLAALLPCIAILSPPPLLSHSSSPSSLAASPASALALPSSSVPTLDMILDEGIGCGGRPSIKPLDRALSHILALMSEIPPKSTKYQFSMTMADRIMEENARSGHSDLAQVNRFALASTFSRTSSLLYRSLQQSHWGGENGAGPIKILRAFPLGSQLDPYIRGMNLHGQHESELASEKLAQELLWLAGKLRDYEAVDEALAQWSYASALASACVTSSPRVKGLIIKTIALLSVKLSKESMRLPREVKFGMLMLWLPLCCHAGNGFSYPTLSGFEKMETERAIDGVLLTLPASDQEIILTNWIQDFTVSSSGLAKPPSIIRPLVPTHPRHRGG